MGLSLAKKIIKDHLIYGDLKEGSSIGLSVDQALTQDATGTMVYLQIEAMELEKIRIPLVVSYVDHNTLQTTCFNPDDHLFLQTSAAKYGAIFSRPGNGICHQVHLERFGAPGKVLIGSDSHTPTGGGIGMIAIGVGGLDVAVSMSGEPLQLNMPEVLNIQLKGRLKKPYVTAMDVILEVLRRLGVKGGLGKIIEYSGDGVKTLTVPERATITNMGAELGATTSIFPSDEITREFLKAQGRESDWKELYADKDAEYDDVIEIDLSEIEPLIAKPYSPDAVVPIREIEGIKIDQVCIGSCTNSSYALLATAANILKGEKVAPNVSLTISPGSKQVFSMIAKDGYLKDMIDAGARILESACGPCIGMGQAPRSGGVSIRTFNRNFKGRSGTKDAKVYLCSPVSAAVMAVKGEIISPERYEKPFTYVEEPEKYDVNDNMFIYPPEDGSSVQVIKGPNIKSVPIKDPLSEVIEAKIILKLGDNITTDDIMPAGSNILPLRSNIPEISKFVFSGIDPQFYKKAKEYGKSVIVGGENYGQGSSREHAAIAPMYLGVQAVIAKSIARIHRKNLINYGILPLVFNDKGDYEKVKEAMNIKIDLKGINYGENIIDALLDGNISIKLNLNVSEIEFELLKHGGLLPYMKNKRRKK